MPFPEGFEDEVGDIVKKARSALGLTLAELSAETGIDEGLLAEVETYDSVPSHDQARRLARSLGLDADKLATLASGDWEAPSVPMELDDGTRVVRIPFASMNCNAYLLVPGGGGPAVLVDAGMGARPLLAALEEHGGGLAAVLITHTHWDHVAGLPGLLDEAAGSHAVPVYLHQLGAEAVGSLEAARLEVVGDGDRVLHGMWDGPTFTAHTVPGHAADSLVFVGGGAAFTGDALFAGSVGGTPDGAAHRQLLDGVRQVILGLPAETRLYCGHGVPTSVAAEMRCNPFFPELAP